MWAGKERDEAERWGAQEDSHPVVPQGCLQTPSGRASRFPGGMCRLEKRIPSSLSLPILLGGCRSSICARGRGFAGGGAGGGQRNYRGEGGQGMGWQRLRAPPLSSLSPSSGKLSSSRAEQSRLCLVRLETGAQRSLFISARCCFPESPSDTG